MKAVIWIAAAVLLVAGVGRMVNVWTECRAFGHSHVYCARVVGR